MTLAVPSIRPLPSAAGFQPCRPGKVSSARNGVWAAASRDGAPQIVVLELKPDPEKLARWAELGVTEVLFGLPDRSEAEVAGYVERLAGKLAALV